VQQERPAPITIEDGMEALRIGVAATRAHETGRSVVVSAIKA
jgi:predicted dehydrogenase